jgi:hypothetical protein
VTKAWNEPFVGAQPIRPDHSGSPAHADPLPVGGAEPLVDEVERLVRKGREKVFAGDRAERPGVLREVHVRR